MTYLGKIPGTEDNKFKLFCRCIMHEFYSSYHKHLYLYPLTCLLYFLLSEKTRLAWFFQCVHCIGLNFKSQYSTDTQDCSQKLNFVSSTAKSTLVSLFIMLMTVQQTFQLPKGKLSESLKPDQWYAVVKGMTFILATLLGISYRNAPVFHGVDSKRCWKHP